MAAAISLEDSFVRCRNFTLSFVMECRRPSPSCPSIPPPFIGFCPDFACSWGGSYLNSRISPVFFFLFNNTSSHQKHFSVIPSLLFHFFFPFLPSRVSFSFFFFESVWKQQQEKMFFSMYSATYLLELDIYRRIYTNSIQFYPLRLDCVGSVSAPWLDYVFLVLSVSH